MAEIVNGNIVEVDAAGITVRVPYTNLERLIHRDYQQVRVELIDSNQRTAEQIRKAWAIMSDIAAAYTGDRRDTEEAVYRPLAQAFAEKRMETQQALQRELFRISTATRSEASAFISYLIDFVLEYDVPMSRPLRENAEDIGRYVYACLRHKKCAVCGQKADLHHVDRVGMGRDRKEICHIGMKALPLCRAHHQEAHQMGDEAFCQLYHLEPVEIDGTIAKVYRLKGGT